MKKMLEALQALEQLGAEWKARRVTKIAPLDTVECASLVQMDEGVARGLVEVRFGRTYQQTKAEVVVYLGGRLEKDGTFKHRRHPKTETAKLFEYENVVNFSYSNGFLGLGRGYHPDDPVPAEHQFLTDFAVRLIAEVDGVQNAVAEEAMAVAKERRRRNEETARRALFG